MFLNKKCVKCGKQATHKFVKIEKSQVYDLYFCQDHAAEESPYQKKGMALPLQEILGSLMSQGQAAQHASLASVPDLKCKTCGLAFADYRKTLILGCIDCYECFREQLLPELRRLHGNIRHIGRRPGGGKEPESTTVDKSVVVKPPSEIVKASAPSPSKGGASLLKDSRQAIEELARKMGKAIEDEDFEKAVHCRDQIKELEQSLKQEKAD